jgi:hypothetical protein
LVIFLEILQFFEKKNLILTHTKNNNLGGKWPKFTIFPTKWIQPNIKGVEGVNYLLHILQLLMWYNKDFVGVNPMHQVAFAWF